ncbi:DUF4279 domain-containing protein [Streptomyces sp. NBC_01433]|uniref:DUF4279 domain-containing protein n=1 Tax=Streptomyces sp. NBC_01433 TaxID=2903864 RepID=UPI00224F73E6|nr:DUF4279 domain-containing protein [Streptomyces sp. NBC_01433]MCX4674182.1 DUF4279 domain-containing protein [Streptomyces sp. NBC_01433]
MSRTAAQSPPGPFRMYVRVISESLRPQEIDDRLGIRADLSYARRSRKRPQSRPYGHTGWQRHVPAPGPGTRPEDLEQIVLGWGDAFARALGELSDSGDADVSLVMVQSIHDLDDEMAKGIVLGAPLIAWLATARACLDIDQYVFHECDEPAAR